MKHTITDRPREDGTRITGSLFTLVAVINPGIDWAAYRDDPQRQQTVERTAESGDKLPEAVARYFFPDIEVPYRW